METTTYICDTCNKTKSKEDLVKITVSVKNLHFINDTSWDKSTINIDICKDCLKSKGFRIEKVTQENKEQIEKHNKKTLEDKIIDILDDIGVVFVE